MYELPLVSLSAVEVFQVLRKSEYSAVLKVAVGGEPRVMKVYRDRNPTASDSPEREIDLFVCESSTYQRLKEKGLCARGVIPYFYGILTNIQPAMALEDINDMHQLDLSTFSESRLLQMESILHDIHKAVLWIDFDCAQRLPEDNFSPRQEMWLQDENELMDYFTTSLPEDYREGKLRRTWVYYFQKKG
ncbi:hypothetical protein BDW42DRAFT_187417 [Aspergillus taichungensis]|uniref:Protein kinase domain-containing protein n=1 Tax=Aspergillus taichungensis TaxID=482145 RepID=A0A2J5HMS8_9EURO|nr:hypothetical protein BDW42DRAFT_187417 [Aspergillus taichungensis]